MLSIAEISLIGQPMICLMRHLSPAHFDFRLFFVMAHDGAMVEAAHAVADQRLQNFHHAGGERQRNVEPMAGVEDVLQILGVQLDAAAGVEVAVEDRSAGEYGK